MLWNASAIKGYAVAASDGRLGTVNDFLFDDARWAVRWLVVDTGTWLSGRKVLLPASVLEHLHPTEHEFPVRLTKQQVKDSPEIDCDRPVSRQMETHVYDYYGRDPYWGTDLYVGGFGYLGGPMMGAYPIESRRHQQHIADMHRNDDDPHLRSIEAVTGYHPCHRRRDRSRRGLPGGRYRLEYPLPRRRYQELVARQEGPDLAAVGTRGQLDGQTGEP